MDILMLVRGDYKSDMRIRREAEHLSGIGHQVHVVCRNLNDRTGQEELCGVKITRISNDSKLEFLFNEGVYAATWYHPALLQTLRKKLQAGSYEVIYYHDIHYAKIAERLADWYGIKTVADLHEFYAHDVKIWRRKSTLRDRLQLGRLLKPAWRFERLERFCINNTDGLVTVSPGLQDYLIEKYEFNGYSGTVRNVPDLSRLDQMNACNTGHNNELILAYIGNFTPQRGLEVIIEALPEIVSSVSDTKVLFVGDGRDSYVSYLKELSEDLGVRKNIEFTGWVEFEKVRSYYEVADVSMCLYYQTHRLYDAMPNKLFQSMAFQTPIIVNNTPSMNEIVQKTETGIVVEDAHALSEAVLKLYDNKKLREEMGENGRKAVEQEYNINIEMKVLDRLLNRIKIS